MESEEVTKLVQEGKIVEAFCACYESSSKEGDEDDKLSQQKLLAVLDSLRSINGNLGAENAERNVALLDQMQQQLESEQTVTDLRKLVASPLQEGRFGFSRWVDLLCSIDSQDLSLQQALEALESSKLATATKEHLRRGIYVASSSEPEPDKTAAATQKLQHLLNIAVGKGQVISWLPEALTTGAKAAVHKHKPSSGARMTQILQTFRQVKSFGFLREVCVVFCSQYTALLQYLALLESARITAGCSHDCRTPGYHDLVRLQAQFPGGDLREDEVVELGWTATQIMVAEHVNTEFQAVALKLLSQSSPPAPLQNLNQAIKALGFLMDLMSSEDAQIDLDPWLRGPYFSEKQPKQTILQREASNVLAVLCGQRLWTHAERWAELTDQPHILVVTEQADCIWDDWSSLQMAGGCVHHILADVRQLFRDHQTLAKQRAEYLLDCIYSKADFVEQEDTTGFKHAILEACLEASIEAPEGTAPPKSFLEQLRKGLALTGRAVDSVASPYEEAEEGWTPFFLRQRLWDAGATLSQAPSLMLRAMSTASNQESSVPWEALTPLRGSRDRTGPLSKAEVEATQEWANCSSKIGAITEACETPNVQQAIRQLLDLGDTGAARSLSKRLNVPPIELALTESALRVFTSVDPTSESSENSAPSTQAFTRAVPTAVLSLLRHRGCTINSTEDLLSCLVKHCKAGAGGTTCSWVESNWKSASLLGISTQKVLELGPAAILEALLLKNAPHQDLQKFVSVTRLHSTKVASILAGLFFKGLLLDETYKDGSTGRSWSTDLFVGLVHRLCEAVDVGNAILQLLVDRHPAILAEQEVEFILAAHRFYNEEICLEGIDSLLDFTILSVGRWIKQKEHKALAKLASGMGQYKPVRRALDSLIREDALETVLQKAAPVGVDSQGRAGASVSRLAVLASIQQHGTSEHLRMACMHYNLQREQAEQLVAQMQEKPEHVKDRLTQSLNEIDRQRLWLEAAQAFRRAECPLKAQECAQNAVNNK